MKATGWIYDAYQEGDEITLWMRTDDGPSVEFTDSFLVEFYAVPKRKDVPAEALAQIGSDHPLVEYA
jgi:hypothetical protein